MDFEAKGVQRILVGLLGLLLDTFRRLSVANVGHLLRLQFGSSGSIGLGELRLAHLAIDFRTLTESSQTERVGVDDATIPLDGLLLVATPMGYASLE